MATPAAHKFKRFAIVDCKRAAGGIQVVLDGGPLDGVEERMPLSASGVMACSTWPDDLDRDDHFYVRTRERRRGRLVCRYNGRRRRA
jgi:hypothetical protein